MESRTVVESRYDLDVLEWMQCQQIGNLLVSSNTFDIFLQNADAIRRVLNNVAVGLIRKGSLRPHPRRLLI